MKAAKDWMTCKSESRLETVQKAAAWVFAASFAFGCFMAAMGFVLGLASVFGAEIGEGNKQFTPWDMLAAPFIPFIFAILITGSAFAYLAPSIVAYVRVHKNSMPIAIVNVVFGIFGVGWIASLIWACTSHTESANNQTARTAKEGPIVS